MFIHRFENVLFISSSAQVKLPRPNLILDPRENYPSNVRFKCHYHDDGITVTLTIIRGSFSESCHRPTFSMRVYDPSTEDVPDFDSTIYKYSGLDDEHAPYDTTVGIIDPSVKIIKKDAFCYCSEMKKCIMHDGVETIEMQAFYGCTYLDALFLPSTLKNISKWAFCGCHNIMILSFPIDIDISQIGREIIGRCCVFFHMTKIPQYRFRYNRSINDDQVHQAVIDLYRNLPPLHRTCLDVNVNVQAIRDCIATHGPAAASITDHGGMTPLHILAINPHATVGCILECFDADMSAAFVEDTTGNTPLDYLKEDNNLAGHNLIMTLLCVQRESTMR